MSKDPQTAPSGEGGTKSNGLPEDLRKVAEASSRINARVEAFARELDERETAARKAELAARESELEALDIARDAIRRASRHSAAKIRVGSYSLSIP